MPDISKFIQTTLKPLTYGQVVQVCHSVFCAWSGDMFVIEELPDELKCIATKLEDTIAAEQGALLMNYVKKRSEQATKHVTVSNTSFFKDFSQTFPAVQIIR